MQNRRPEPVRQDRRPFRLAPTFLFIANALIANALLAHALLAQTPCPGDCDANRAVTVDEITLGIRLALRDASSEPCDPMDGNTDGRITVDELALAASHGLEGCEAPRVRRCNGAERLCARRYDEVVYATTHNAMSNAADRWQVPNQNLPITEQLADGIRALMLDTHEFQGDSFLCHSDCVFLGRQRLASGLREIGRFLDAHPDEIVTIIFEAYIDPQATADAFRAAGLMDDVHSQTLDEPWPTLGTMIDAGRRLVVLSDRRADPQAFPWQHYVWDHAFETPFSFRTPGDLSCRPNRGNPDNRLFILNHFLTIDFGRPSLARQINFNPSFAARAAECAAANEALPNFVTVDFHDIGDVIDVVNELNR